MHPKLSGTAIIANRQGKVDIVDVNNPGATKSFQTSHYTHTAHTAHNQGTVLTQIELSPSGDVLAMMDSDGVLQMWSAFGKRNFTEFGAPVEWPEPPTRPSIVMTDTTYVTLYVGCLLHMLINYKTSQLDWYAVFQ